MAIKTDKVTIEITQEACRQLRSFLIYDREGTSEGYSDFILKAINIRQMVANLEADNAAQLADLQAENERLRAALKPFARVGELVKPLELITATDTYLWKQDSTIPTDSFGITLADCIAARRVLGEER